MDEPQQAITPRTRNFLIGAIVILLSLLALLIVLIIARLVRKKKVESLGIGMALTQKQAEALVQEAEDASRALPEATIQMGLTQKQAEA
jgi:hypothetical protein